MRNTRVSVEGKGDVFERSLKKSTRVDNPKDLR